MVFREVSVCVINKDNFVSIVVVYGLNGDGNKLFWIDDKKFWLGDEDMFLYDIVKSCVFIFNYFVFVIVIFGRIFLDIVL